MFYVENDNKIVLFDDDKQKLQDTIAFMPQYQGLEIKEVQEGYVIYNFELMTVEEKEEKEAQKEHERLNLLSMTKREMFLGLYQAKGITPDMLKAQITDPQALIEFEYANDYYRGNPLIDVIGGQLGFTSEQLDKFFETKDYIYLTACELTIKATPAEATVTGDGSYPYGTLVDYKVELEGYKPYTGSIELLKDTELNIELEKIEEVVDENTTDTTTDANNEDEVEAEPTGDVDKE